MSSSPVIKAVVPSKETKWIACGFCRRETNHEVLTLVEYADENDDGSIHIWCNYMTLKCQGCNAISFADESYSTADIEYDTASGEQSLVPLWKLYPDRIVARPELQYAYHLPEEVYKIYRETYAAFCNNLPILTAIGIRAIIETVCNDNFSTGDPKRKKLRLWEKIDTLVTEGFVLEEGGKILKEIKDVGNDAAHEVKVHTSEELAVALDIIEHLLEAVYILPERSVVIPKKPRRGSS